MKLTPNKEISPSFVQVLNLTFNFFFRPFEFSTETKALLKYYKGVSDNKYHNNPVAWFFVSPTTGNCQKRGEMFSDVVDISRKGYRKTFLSLIRLSIF